MSGASHRRRIFSIPAGAPFLETFADALLAGRIIENFPRDSGPLALADARIYIPTRRAARALTEELARRSRGAGLLLPHIVPLGMMEETADMLAFSAPGIEDARLAALAPGVSALERRLRLSHLVLQWAKALRDASSRGGDAGQSFDDSELNVVAHAPAQAWYLAGELAALIDEMLIENIDPQMLKGIPVENLEKYWQITLQFLEIAFAYWPDELAQLGKQDATARQIALINHEIELLGAGGASPTQGGPRIVLGSTGTNAATARLIAAIARAPQGAVVLPGYDDQLDGESWAALSRPAIGEDADPAIPAHPQAALHRLIKTMDAARDDIVTLGAPRDPLRMDFLREAMRPAVTTHNWPQWRKDHGAEARTALSAIKVIEANDERQEALAIALALRETLETPHFTAALVTPDRALSRRVRMELLRWNIEIDDSGGEPLSLTPAGNLAALSLAAAQDSVSASALQSLLDHGGINLGLAPETFRKLRRQAALGLFRGIHPDISNPAATIETARALARDVHAHPSRKSISDEDWPRLQDFLERLRAALEPLGATPQTAHLAHWMRAHESTMQLLMAPQAGEALSSPDPAEDWQALRELFSGFHLAESPQLPCTLQDYSSILSGLMRETAVRGPRRAHPRLKILGLLEARLLDADLIVLGGLSETVWPPAAKTNALLNRQMRAWLGLSSPERRIGQTAHDFVQAMGAKQVVLSHARKNGDAPAAPSRFLLRMAALAGEEAWTDCKARGDIYLDLARRIDKPLASESIQSPQPCPPVAWRPVKLPVTSIETWRRDPYSIYAERILKLKPLDDVDREDDAAAAGSLLHAAMAEFHQKFAHGTLPADAHDQLIACVQRAFAPLFSEPDFEVFKWPRWKRSLKAYLEWEAERRASRIELLTEMRGEIDIPLFDGSQFTLTARADRIERMADGIIAIADYKTGSPPSAGQISSGLAPQLTLEGVIAQQGGFEGVSPFKETPQLLYLRIAANGDFRARDIADGNNKVDVANAMNAHFRGLLDLASQFRDPHMPYRARPVAQFASKWLKYDHLSRYKEWSASGENDA